MSLDPCLKGSKVSISSPISMPLSARDYFLNREEEASSPENIPTPRKVVRTFFIDFFNF